MLMPIATPFLFVYGTLLLSDNDFGRYLKNNCTFFSHGRFKGKLFDIGEYPGAIIDQSGNHYVHGSIYKLHNADKVLKILDEYEGVGENEIQPNLYTRGILQVDTTDGSYPCWVYLYNWPLDAKVFIEGGDYLKYKR
ncbi:gamma-glutamylcyclotransferase [Mucilaginibacter gynuensis]|uniref:Gamma-glutamylcyclotransferase n=2 Tax=Mucilaginibacter gynuensis TaxID=1302236 RepID=A0ABP8G0S6_9SPHI